MKRILLTTAATVALLVFAGCAESAPTSENGTNGTQTLETPPPPVEVPEVNEADNAAYSGALRLLDVSFCEKIGDEQLKEKCTTDVNDQKIVTEATKERDASLCDQVSTDDKKEACKTSVEVAVAQETAVARKQEALKAGQMKEDEIVASGDYTRCKELEEPSNVYDCEISILANKAVQEKDPSWCEKASREDIREQCEFMYTSATDQESDTAPQPPGF